MGQMAEQLGRWAINQKVVGSIPGRANWRCVLRQSISPYLLEEMGMAAACRLPSQALPSHAQAVQR